MILCQRHESIALCCQRYFLESLSSSAYLKLSSFFIYIENGKFRHPPYCIDFPLFHFGFHSKDVNYMTFEVSFRTLKLLTEVNQKLWPFLHFFFLVEKEVSWLLCVD